LPISFKELNSQLAKKLAAYDPEDAQVILDIKIQHMLQALENFRDLDEEGKALVNEWIAGIADSVSTKAAHLPDSARRREMERAAATLSGRHYRVSDLATELASNPSESEPFIEEGESSALKLLQHAADLMFEGARSRPCDKASLVLTALLSGVMSDLTAAVHLGKHRYCNQAINLVRTAHETLDKIELFRQEPSWIDLWNSGGFQEQWRELSPAKVRQKLGKEAYDPLYSFYSETGTHVQLKSIQNRTVIEKDNDTDANPTVRIWVGGTRIAFVIVLTFSWILHEIARFLSAAARTYAEYLNPSEVEKILDEGYASNRDYCLDHCVPLLAEHGIDVAGLRASLKNEESI